MQPHISFMFLQVIYPDCQHFKLWCV